MNGDLDDREALAAEYVLGTLAPADRARAEAERAHDPAFARLIDDWAAKLSPVAEAVGEVAAPPEAWKGIETALADRLRPIAADVRTSPRRHRPPLLRRLSFWRWSTAGALAVAALLALYIADLEIFTPEAPTRYVALLNDAEANPAWLLTVDTEEHTLVIRPLAQVELAIEENDLQLWLIKDARTAVRPVGLLHHADARVFEISETVVEEGRLEAAAFAVSLEPLGGSPTGLPTGPVLYQGGVFPIEH